MSQKINIDVTPGKMMPMLYYSQGDVGRTFQIAIVSSDGYELPTGATVTLQATKPSGFGFSVEADSVTNGVATFTTTATMTDEYGRFPAEIQITDGDDVIYSANFIMVGEKNPHPDGTIDGSEGSIVPELTLLVERVEAAAESIHDLTVSATTLAAGSNATATYDDATNNITFGIPKGADGTVTEEQLDAAVSDLKNTINEDRNLLDYSVIESANKWNPEEQVTDKVVSNASTNKGELVDGTGYTTSGFISAVQNDVIRWDYKDTIVGEGTLLQRGTTVFRIAEYDSAKNCLLVTANWATLPYTVQNANTAYVRVSVQTRPTNSIIFGDTSTSQIHYIAYSKTPYFGKIAELESNIEGLETSTIELESDIVLPSFLYAVDGQEINIYKENLVLPKRLRTMPYLHTRLVKCTQDDYRTIWTPTATVLRGANSAFELCYGNGEVVKSYPIGYYIVPKDTGSGEIKVLICGDSKIQNGYVSYHFLHNFDDDNMSCTLLGSKYQWQTDNRNEGYGSRTATWFATNADSPCVFNGVFDFSQYMADQGYDEVDFVFLNFGTNDATQATSGYSETFVSAMNTMIASIHAYDPNISIIVGLCEGVCTFWDSNYSEFIKWDANNKIQQLHKATIQAFDNRQDERIYVCPMYMGMDLTQDYNMEEIPLSQRDADVNSGQGNGKTRMRVLDRVHQNEVGYWKNADYMYAIVKYIVAKSQA